MAAGAGEVDAWAAHGAAAAARAQRVMSAVRLARARAEAELAAARHATEEPTSFAWRTPSDAQAHASELRAARAELRRLREAARLQLAEAEDAARLKRARQLAAKAAEEARQAEEEARRAEEEAQKRGAAESRRRAKEAEEARQRAEEAAAAEAGRLAAAEEAKRKSAEEDAKRKADAERKQKERTEAAAKAQADDDEPPDARQALEALYVLEAEGKAFGEGMQSEVKRARLDVRRAINKACNQIAGTQAQVERCARALADALRAAAHRGASARAWAIAYAARRLVEGGEDAVGHLAQFAWAYTCAAALRQLGTAQPQFAKALHAALLDTAPAVAAHFPRRRPGGDAAAYRQRLRARPGEGADAYASRAAKACALFAALCQTCDGAERLSMPALWRWAARAVNARPHPLKPQVVVAVLEVAGFELSRCYARQFAKLMAAVQQRVWKKADKRSPPGPLANLADLIHTFVKDSGRFIKPPTALKPMAAVQRRVRKKADKRSPLGLFANFADLIHTFVRDTAPPKGELLPKSDSRDL